MARRDDRASRIRSPGRASRSIAATLACVLAGCGGGGGGSGKPIDGAVDGAVDVDAAGLTWWQPSNEDNANKNWDIQLSAPIDTSAPRVMYDLDLWSLVPSATMLRYDDGSMVSVPAGALAGTIAALHARTPSTIVICHVETGILDLSLPDAPKFPGYHADASKIPDQSPPEPGSVIGWHVGTSQKRWLDIRAASRAVLLPILFRRFDLAAQIGCDGVEPDRNLAVEFEAQTGWAPIDPHDSYSWFAELAKQGHARKLSTGMKNGHTLAGQVDSEADTFDWMMVERCGEDQLCDTTRPFINLHKAVFAIDYDHNIIGDPQDSLFTCDQQALAMIADGLVKDVGLSSAVRTQCIP
ncbi:MAG TPA: endo alpha-1,4 polygalactosaminidase [Kofleriaceae bacterium]|nr:endo alpha-1,4 polygalactosaminidase [Kofleriaceae bacterium]